MHFLVAQLRLAENFRLQFELNELFHAATLHEHLRSLLVNPHAELVFLREENCPFLRRELESELFEQRPKLCHLLVRERMGVRIHFFRNTLNARRSTLNHFVIPSEVEESLASSGKI